MMNFGICADRPNIIFILADDLGYSDMGWQGSAVKTPNLDRLRKEGMFLQRHYVQPQCTPSRVAFLSGNYPYRYGMQEHIVVPWSLNGMPSEVKTVAEKLKEGGYRTAVVGKWHVGTRCQSYLPHHQGFDDSFAAIGGAISYWNYSEYGFSDIISNGEKYYAKSNIDSEDSKNEYVTDLWTRKAVEMMNPHEGNKPFFLYLAYTAPHHPLQAPKEILDKYESTEVDSYWSGANAEFGRTSQDRKAYMAMVDQLDKGVGQVLAALKEKGLMDNTLIIFCSDNGGIPQSDNRPYRSAKGDSFEGGVRVPCIAWWPGKIQANSTSSELVYMADWYATFSEMAGLNHEKDIDGISASEILKGNKGRRKYVPIISASRHALINEKYALVGNGSDYNQLVQNHSEKFALYDLEVDPSQKTDIMEQHPEMVESMKKILGQHFVKANSGFYNWDSQFSEYRLEHRTGDHNLDWVKNDIPKMKLIDKNGVNYIEAGPMLDEFKYTLCKRGSPKDIELDRYFCKKNETQYRFSTPIEGSNLEQYHIKVSHHFGMPIRDGFDLTTYKIGRIASDHSQKKAQKLLPSFDGLLPICDVKGGAGIEIAKASLSYGHWPEIGGSLHLKNLNGTSGVALGRYFMEPHSLGKRSLSFLFQVKNFNQAQAKISLLRYNWKATTASFGIEISKGQFWLTQTHGPRIPITSQLNYGFNEVHCLLVALELGPTGQDQLQVVLDPKPGPVQFEVKLSGEFTFDRLELSQSGSELGELHFDEFRLGEVIADVLPCP